MPKWTKSKTGLTSDEAYQDDILLGVSRTFALTIPQLPQPLFRAVGNAYLLCRIADTIEDDAGLSPEAKNRFADEFIDVVAGRAEPEPFAARLHRALSPKASEAEHDLIKNTERVIRVTRGFSSAQQAAMARCVRIMATGMAHFQRNQSPTGLADLAALDSYCYHVAGVVGEMLTELYAEYSGDIAERRNQMLPLAISFGQGLQMTNILKDVWDDRARGACWLPRSVFAAHGVDLARLQPQAETPAGFVAGLRELIAVAQAHLANALAYTLLIPARERGIRKFCLWALGMAIWNLRKIHRRPRYRSGREVKISRASVRAITALTALFAGRDAVLRLLFRLASIGLPRVNRPVTIFRTPIAPASGGRALHNKHVASS